MSESLKPCPFCGSEKLDLHSVGTGFGDAWCVLCPACGASTKVACESRDEAANKWNMRTAVGDTVFSMAIHDGGIWRKEQTCRNVDEGREFACSECGARYFILSQGEPTEPWAHVRRPGHCPNCGAKVVGA